MCVQQKIYLAVRVHENVILCVCASKSFFYVPANSQSRLSLVWGLTPNPRRLTLSFQQQHGYSSFYFQRKPPLAQTTTNTETGCPSSL